MIDLFDKIGRATASCLRLLPPEFAHELGMRAMSLGALNCLPDPLYADHGVQLTCDLPGIGKLINPVGLAAGFDKNALCPGAFQKMGFSFIELGTVTPLPQPGNSKPRIFRYSDQRSIVNRMGFNSDGSVNVAKRLESHRWTQFHIPLGINMGKNKDTPNQNALRDYVQVFNQFQNLAKYFVINISSPNTPGLRELANPEFIKEIALSIDMQGQNIWIKVDPDMPKRDFQRLIEAINENGFAGVILSNTHRVDFPERGGQSGHPLLSLSNAMLEWAWQVHEGRLAMIGSGGILTGTDAFHKIARGASAVQLYTALVFRGPGAVARILEELCIELKLRGFSTVGDAVGSWYKE